MEINTYTDYIVERVEILSVVAIAATGVVFLKYGFLASCVPPMVFHAGAYFSYRRFKQNRKDTT